MKRSKMNLSDMELHKIYYHASQRIKNRDGIHGTRYILSAPLTPDQIAVIVHFKNTLVSSCSYRYAPEIKYDCLILFDKCI